jgi:hypothetical protein
MTEVPPLPPKGVRTHMNTYRQQADITSDAQLDTEYVRIAQRSYLTVAEKLEEVARRMRQLSERLPGMTRQTAVSAAAEAVSEYVQGVGSIGTHLWAVVHDAEHLDRFRREQSAGAQKVTAANLPDPVLDDRDEQVSR